MKENILVNLCHLSDENIKTTFKWIHNQTLRELFSMNGKPNWDNHINYFKKKLNDKTQKVFAIYANNHYVGNCGLKNIDLHKAEIWIYIGEDNFKGKGIATKAIGIMIAYAKKINLQKLYLYVLNYNKSALKLYKNSGFKYVSMNDSDRQIWFGRDENLLKMELIMDSLHYFCIGGGDYSLVL